MSFVTVVVLIALLIVYGLRGFGRALKQNVEWFIGLFKKH